jgi:hypothetical protein
MLPGDAMNERYKVLYGPGPYRKEGGFYQCLTETLDEQARE